MDEIMDNPNTPVGQFINNRTRRPPKLNLSTNATKRRRIEEAKDILDAPDSSKMQKIDIIQKKSHRLSQLPNSLIKNIGKFLPSDRRNQDEIEAEELLSKEKKMTEELSKFELKNITKGGKTKRRVKRNKRTKKRTSKKMTKRNLKK